MCDPIDMALLALMGGCIGVASAATMQMLGDRRVPATVTAVISLCLAIVTLLCYVMVKAVTFNAL